MDYEYLGLGSLITEQMYAYFDRPVVFLAHTVTQGLYIFVLAEDSPTLERWLALPVSVSRVRLLENHRMTLRDALLDPEEGWLFHINIEDSEEPVRTVISRVDVDDLPNEASWVTNEPMQRDILELHLLRDDSSAHVIDPSLLGAFLQKLNSFLQHAAQEYAKQKIPDLFKVRAFTPGSFGVIMETYGPLKLFSDDTFENKARTKLFMLLEDLSIQGLFSSLVPTAKNQFRYLLKILVHGKYGLDLTWHSYGSPVRLDISLERLQKILNDIETESEGTEEVIEVSGRIVGLQLEKNSFTFRTTDNRRFTGAISPQLDGKSIEIGLSKSATPLVLAKLLVMSEFNTITFQENVSYLLQDVAPLQEDLNL